MPKELEELARSEAGDEVLPTRSPDRNASEGSQARLLVAACSRLSAQSLHFLRKFQLVYMRNIPYSYTEEKITELIASKTPVKVSAISLPTHKFGQHKGSRRGFGFVTVSSEEDQNKLIEALEGLELSPEKPAAGEANATEGAEAKEERKFKLVARKGYENEEKEAEKEDAAGAAGEQQSGEVVAAPGGATPAVGGSL